MNLHSLKIQGFGPFKDLQSIDFEALSQDKIFMLEGPTGAGKSSIIDAIVFALYGKTAHEAATKNGPSGERVRSDYCDPTDETKVILEFTTGGSTYRVSRTAAYDAPKKNGIGTTPINEKATLEFLSPPREAINQVREVNMRIKEELSMDHEQFSQMVVLPQGDFASFLHATSEDRLKVLKGIFKTFFFDSIEKYLNGKAKEIEVNLASCKSEIEHHLRNLEKEWHGDSSDLDFEVLLKTLIDDNLDKTQKENSLFNAVKTLQPSGEVDEKAKVELESKISPLKAKLTLLEASETRLNDKKKLEGELKELKDKQESISKLEDEIKLIQKVQPLRALTETRDSAQETMDINLSKIPKRIQNLTSVKVKARIKELNLNLPKLQKDSEAASTAEDSLERISNELDESLRIEASIKNLARLETQYSKSEAALKKLEVELKSYRAKQTEEFVSEAAKLLKKGQPCPVCGSKEHPKRAKASSFDEDHLYELENQVDIARSKRDDAKTSHREALKDSQRKFAPSSKLKAEKAKLEKLSEKTELLEDKYKKALAERDELIDLQSFFMAYESAQKLFETASAKLSASAKSLKLDEKEVAVLLEKNTEDLTSEVSNYWSRIKEINAILSQADFKSLDSNISFEAAIGELHEQIRILDADLEKIKDRLAVQSRIIQDISDAKQGILDALSTELRVRKESSGFIDLQSWVSGANSRKLKLTNFVLQERLELILEYASKHLRRISNGKYEFRLFEEKRGNQMSGLGITIMDYFAGKERPAETLSGGETFYASLALALGLVEVVKADNGGIELGTLFIDEGFGSLSDDTLEEVIDVLEDLRAERVIGIISHVEGMKTQIPIRLEVRPTEEGPSNVRMAVAGMK